MFSRSGCFPAECVHPIAAPDFLSLPLDRTAEPRGGAGQFAASSAVAVAVASTVAAHEIDQTIEVLLLFLFSASALPVEVIKSNVTSAMTVGSLIRQRVSLDGLADGELDERALHDSQYDMLEFAKKYFRQGSRGKG